MKRPIIIILLLFLSFNLVYAQGTVKITQEDVIEKINSLKIELKQSADEDGEIHILLEIMENYQNHNLDSLQFYADLTLAKSQESGNLAGEIAALNFQGIVMLYTGVLPKAVEISLKAISLADEATGNLRYGKGSSYDRLANIYVSLKDFDKAKFYTHKLLSVNKDDYALPFGTYKLAVIFLGQNELDSALIYANKSIEFFKKIKSTNGLYPSVYPVYPLIYNVMARVYQKRRQNDLALVNLKKSLALTEDNYSALFNSETYYDLAEFYQTLEKPDSSIFYAEKALEAGQKLPFAIGILNASKLLAELHKPNDARKALEYYELAAETQNGLFGAGNIQAMQAIIASDENRTQEIADAELAYSNKLRLYVLIGSLAVFLIISFLLYRNNRQKQKANLVLGETLSNLKSTQSQLIQSEKMASLGELTAGIAHEIQNPLNFVNNFSEVNEELIEEVLGERKKALRLRSGTDLELIDELIGDIKENLKKINHHGNRASSIVKGMLEHSQTSSGEKVSTDINALADEYLRLSYHGLKAKDDSFQCDFKTDFDKSLPKVNVIPQDIGRVLLNLINNAFQACAEKRLTPVTERSRSDKPLVTISTKLTANSQVLIAVKDNGPGIPREIKDKIFQPFFTTRPTGKGTGLGLSLAYDIVSAHGGELTLESTSGTGSEFLIKLPI